MCGILGLIGGGSTRALSDRFDAALDVLKHRGPDDRGVYGATDVLLGHRRLSILDLSAAGHQPMVEPHSESVLVFNGEIYNHVELRAELEKCGHRFFGHSDTEVLLHALDEWGAAALPRLNGMWALAYWSPRRRQLLLARDRFGVKPLYFRLGHDGFAFASEPKALLALYPLHRAVEESALLDFLGNNLLYANGDSFYQGIKVFPPAHYAVHEPGATALEFKRYWDYPDDVAEGLSEHDAMAEFFALFSDAVRLRLRSDVAVGITLSGGLDSTGVLAAASMTAQQPLTCFTSVYSETHQGERPWAELASKAANAKLIPVIAPQEEWLDTLRRISWYMDAPGYSPAVYPLWHLMKRARAENIPVLLEGQGADEALAGYPQYAALDLLSYLCGGYTRSRSFSGARARFGGLTRTFSLRWTLSWLAREMLPAVLNWRRQQVGFQSLMRVGLHIPARVPDRTQATRYSVQDRLLADHSRNILPGLLHYGDAMSMAHGIEARNPFLDYRLVEWMFRLPASFRFNNGETKWVLREYLRRNGQIGIGNRPDKKGYPTPVGQWLASPQGSDAEALLLAGDSQILRWCDREKVRKLIRQNRDGVLGAEHHLYKLLSTQLWLQECVEGKAT